MLMKLNKFNHFPSKSDEEQMLAVSISSYQIPTLRPNFAEMSDLEKKSVLFQLMENVFSSNIKNVQTFLQIVDGPNDDEEQFLNEDVNITEVDCCLASTEYPEQDTQLEFIAEKRSEIDRSIQLEASSLEYVEKYSDEDFYYNFKMSKGTFSKLHNELNRIDSFVVVRIHGKAAVDSRLKIQIALAYLSTSDQTMKQLGEKFNISLSSVFNCINSVCRALCELSPKYIVWPKDIDRFQISKDFQRIADLPGVIGAIGCVPIKARFPYGKKDDKLNKNVFLQGICTSKNIFTYIYVPPHGRQDDALTVLESSDIENVVNAGETEGNDSTEEYYLAGDLVYPLKSWLMVPYIDFGALSDAQLNFNSAINKTRKCINKTFQLLVSRWRRLLYVDTNKMDRLSSTIIAACVLHNFCKFNQDYLDDVSILDDGFPLPSNQVSSHELSETNFEIYLQAEAKRDRLKSLLMRDETS